MTTIAVIGGAGALGSGLARRWARAGHALIIGSRNRDKAEQAARTLCDEFPAAAEGAENGEAARRGDVIAVTVPFSAQRETLAAIRAHAAGKIVIDTTVSLKPPRVGTVQLPPEGSAGVIAATILGPDARLVSAFQNVSALLLKSDKAIDCDVLVCGNDAQACAAVCALAADAGLGAYHAGPIENAAAAEAMTSLLITLNRTHKGAHAGIRITGLAETT